MRHSILVFAWLLGLAPMVLAQVPITVQVVLTGDIDFTGADKTLPVKAGTSAETPATCIAQKELYIKTDAPPGQQLFLCNAAGDGWHLVGNGGSGSGDASAVTSASAGTANNLIQYAGNDRTAADSGLAVSSITTASLPYTASQAVYAPAASRATASSPGHTYDADGLTGTRHKCVTVTSNTPISARCYHVNTSSGNVTMTLSKAAMINGAADIYELYKVSDDANQMILAAATGDNLNFEPQILTETERGGGFYVEEQDGATTGNWLAQRILASLPVASATEAGIVELATSAETTTGTSQALAVTPDSLAGSVFGTKYLTVECIERATAVTAGDGKCYYPIHADLDGWGIVSVTTYIGAAVSSSGSVRVDIDRCAAVTTGIGCSSTAVSIFTTLPSIDANENRSSTGTAAVMNATNAALSDGQWLRMNVEAGAAGTGTQGLFITLGFRKP